MQLLPTDRVKSLIGKVPSVFSVILEVRMDVHGDAYEVKGGSEPAKILNHGEDASLIVPTTKSGKKWVEARIVDDSEVISDEEDAARSFILDSLSLRT